MTSNLETLYDILTVYHSRFEGVTAINVQLNETGIAIQAVWDVSANEVYPEGGRIEVTKFIHKQEMESIQDDNGEHFEKHILDFIESIHMKWEVGEE